METTENPYLFIPEPGRFDTEQLSPYLVIDFGHRTPCGTLEEAKGILEESRHRLPWATAAALYVRGDLVKNIEGDDE